MAVSALTTLTTPWLIRASGPAASLVDRKLPHPLQTFAALYGTWLEQLRRPRSQHTASTVAKRILKLLLLDAALLAFAIIGAAISADAVANWLSVRFGLLPAAGRALFVLGAFMVASPFAYGVVRLARQFGVVVAVAALPEEPKDSVDLAAAPRATLVVTLQLAIVLLVGLPLLALTQPFLPGMPSALVLVLCLSVVGLGFWRSASDLHGHVRAGAEIIIEALAGQARAGDTRSIEPPLARVQHLLPGLGEPETVTLSADSVATGKTLAQLDLLGLTGATVLVIYRGDKGVLVPVANEVLQAGDVLVLTGTHEAAAAARELLLETGASAGAEHG